MIYKNLIVLAAFGAVFLHPIATNTIITAEDNDIDDNVTNFPYHDDILEVENIVCGQNLLETMYVSSSIGKSHRFYLTQGERKNGTKKDNCFSISSQYFTKIIFLIYQ